MKNSRGMDRKTFQTDYTGIESQTDQTQAKKGDINEVLRRYRQVGIVEHLNQVDAQFLDVTELPQDYKQVLDYTRLAEEEFMRLPSKLREVFNHDVAEWLDAAHASPEEQDAILAKAGLGGTPDAAPDSGSAAVSTEAAGDSASTSE